MYVDAERKAHVQRRQVWAHRSLDAREEESRARVAANEQRAQHEKWLERRGEAIDAELQSNATQIQSPEQPNLPTA